MRWGIKQKILISLSLPKTGTTYLESLLAQVESVTLPKIKEPSYYFSVDACRSATLASLLSPGNYFRGEKWYGELYKDHDGNGLLVDFSTQYWLYPEQVIENSLEAYDPIFILIKRSKVDQLTSYISHMRRGHIGNDAIRTLINDEPELLEYLGRMANWNKKMLSVKKKYPDIVLIEIMFEEIISNPLSVLRKIIPGILSSDIKNWNVSQNQKSYPRLALLNRIAFSKSTRRLGRVLPQNLYTYLINLRKKFVRINLKKGESTCFDDDKSFVIDTFK